MNNNLQSQIEFPTESPINIERLSKQSKRLYDWLNKGNTIHIFHPMKRELKIGFINSRIPEIKKAGIDVYKRMIKHPDCDGNLVSCKEYSLIPFE